MIGGNIATPQLVDAEIAPLAHGVIPAGVEGVATTHSLDREPAAPEDAVFLNDLQSVLRAGRVKAAGWRQPSRYGHLVHAGALDRYFLHCFDCNPAICSIPLFLMSETP